SLPRPQMLWITESSSFRFAHGAGLVCCWQATHTDAIFCLWPARCRVRDGVTATVPLGRIAIGQIAPTWAGATVAVFGPSPPHKDALGFQQQRQRAHRSCPVLLPRFLRGRAPEL